jgi:CRISPR-associated protein Csm3
MKWEKIVRLKFEIVCLEGLRIGGSGGGLEIGELVEANLALLRNPVNDEFYIPGSSLKGKLRSVLERKDGKVFVSNPRKSEGEPCGCGSCMICIVFGAHKNPNAPSAPTRIVVRDSFLSQDCRDSLKQREKESRPTVEIKTENIINRKTGTAREPRTGERVLPGTRFDGEVVIHIYEGDDQSKMIKLVRDGMGIIQDGSSLGASGSRGYGRVRFENVTEKVLKLDQLTV